MHYWKRVQVQLQFRMLQCFFIQLLVIACLRRKAAVAKKYVSDMYTKQTMSSFWNDFADGFAKPFEWAYNKVDRLSGVGDKLIDTAGNVVTATGNIAGGLGNLLSGNSNIILYLGIGIIAVVALPVILQKVL
jgi:hypothetical protein